MYKKYSFPSLLRLSINIYIYRERARTCLWDHSWGSSLRTRRRRARTWSVKLVSIVALEIKFAALMMKKTLAMSIFGDLWLCVLYVRVEDVYVLLEITNVRLNGLIGWFFDLEEETRLQRVETFAEGDHRELIFITRSSSLYGHQLSVVNHSTDLRRPHGSNDLLPLRSVTARDVRLHVVWSHNPLPLLSDVTWETGVPNFNSIALFLKNLQTRKKPSIFKLTWTIPDHSRLMWLDLAAGSTTL